MSEWIDVTCMLVDGMAGWPGDPAFRLGRVADIEHDGAMVSEIRTSAHIGTHLDAPLHCLADGGDVASVSLSRLCGAAVVIEAAGLGGVTPGHLQGADVRPGDRVLLRMEGGVADAETRGRGDAEREGSVDGARRRDGDGATGRGGEGENAGQYAFVTVEAARWLIELGVVLLGVDCMSPDSPDAHDLPVHHILLGAGVPILEGLDLRLVAPGRYEMIALPLPIRGCEASPARVILRRE